MTENQSEFKSEKFEVLPSEKRADMLANEQSMLFNIAKFEHAQRVANMLYGSKMWPEHIKTVGDALITLDLAERLGVHPVMLAQTIYIIHGKPGLEGKLIASLINNSGKYSEPLHYEFSGTGYEPSNEYQEVDGQKGDYGCRAISIDKRSGKEVRGPKITWDLVRAEGWYNKNRSKWPTMPELMFMYRAASWFCKIHCPEVMLGMSSVEELKDADIVDMAVSSNGSYSAEKEDPEKAVEDLEAKILGNGDNGKVEKSSDDELREHELYKTFNPYEAELQARYGDAKVLKMRDWLDAKGVTWRPSWPGRRLHEKLLEYAPSDSRHSVTNGNNDAAVADEAVEKNAIMHDILEDFDGKVLLDALNELKFATDMRTLSLDALRVLDERLRKTKGETD